MRDNQLIRLLAYATGLVNQELLLQNEYLAAENRILKSHCKQVLRLNDGERATLAEIGKRLGAAAEVKCLRLPARSPNLNAYAERWVGSVKRECLSQLILFGEGSLRRALQQFVAHYHAERNHQGKNNLLLFLAEEDKCTRVQPPIRCTERLGGLLKYYHRRAA